MIRVLLVDDHKVFRESLAYLIDHEEGMVVIGQGGSLAEAQAVLDSETVDVAVVDLSLPDGDGSELIRKLRHVNPFGSVLVLTASAKRDDYARAVEAGASGICHKSTSVDVVVDSIRRLYAGQALLGPDEVIDFLRLASQQRERDWAAQGRLSQLTKRERQVLESLAGGLHDKEIAELLNVSPDTVRTHMVSILTKLGVDSRLQALIFAVRHGAIRFDQIASTST